jgi:SPP1 gp7 family putative phage head morphogenesis protein
MTRRLVKRKKVVRKAGRVGRLDPSRTITLRRQFQADLSRRFAKVAKELTRLIVEEDALGLKPRPTLVFHAGDEPGRWITVRGNHVFIPEGKDTGDVIKKHFEELKGKKETQPGQSKQSAIKQTETPEFKRWFGDSKVVDEKGEPLVVYHGTTADFDIFDTQPNLGLGAHFGTSEQAAFRAGMHEGTNIKPVHLMLMNPIEMKDHTWDRPDTLINWAKSAGLDSDGKLELAKEQYWNSLLSAEAKMRKLEREGPLNEYRTAKHEVSETRKRGADKVGRIVRQRIEQAGFDGVKYQNEVEGKGISWIAFHPHQIKSASGNRGTFDPDDPIITHAEGRWQFHSIEQKLTMFREWFKRLVFQHLVGEHLSEDDWWNKYIADGFRRGTARAFDDTRPQVKAFLGRDPESVRDFYDGTREEFLRSSFNWPVSREKVRVLASRTFTDLRGVTDHMAARVSHTLVDGLTKGDHPSVIARELRKNVSMSATQSKMVARTEIIRAHSEGQLDAFEKMGVTEVGVMAEWATADDDRVCKLCAPLDGVVLKVGEARGLLPRHPNCRCCWTPANVGEDKSEQKRTKGSILGAFDRSYEAEMPKSLDRTLGEQKKLSSWGGADKSVSRTRPKSVLD